MEWKLLVLVSLCLVAVVSSGSCSTGKCKFTCSNNKCIHMEKLCDGVDDCGNGDDEDLKTCPNYEDKHFIRSGDMIALKNDYYGSWLSGHYTSHGDKWLALCYKCTKKEVDWSSCAKDKFYIYASGRADGEVIGYGDYIRLKYKYNSKWVTCERKSEGYCKRDESTGRRFRIYGDPTRGGDKIVNGQKVFIRYGPNLDNEMEWLASGISRWVFRANCTGAGVNYNDASKCRAEMWQIFGKP